MQHDYVWMRLASGPPSSGKVWSSRAKMRPNQMTCETYLRCIFRCRFEFWLWKVCLLLMKVAKNAKNVFFSRFFDIFRICFNFSENKFHIRHQQVTAVITMYQLKRFCKFQFWPKKSIFWCHLAKSKFHDSIWWSKVGLPKGYHPTTFEGGFIFCLP